MALYTVSSGNIAAAEDLNQIIRLLNGTDAGDITLTNGQLKFGTLGIKAKTLSGSITKGGTTLTTVNVAHGLGRLPLFLFGYWGDSQAQADAGQYWLEGRSSANPGIIWGNLTSFTTAQQIADATNIILSLNASSATTKYYRIYCL